MLECDSIKLEEATVGNIVQGCMHKTDYTMTH